MSVLYIARADYYQLPACPTGYITTASSCYWLSDWSQNVSYSNARSACRTQVALDLKKNQQLGQYSIRGDLASVHSSLDLIALAQAMKVKEAGSVQTGWWIGLNDIQKEGIFTWTDSTPVDFLAWAENQPDNWRVTNGEDCGTIYSRYTYLFNDMSCSNENAYVCGFSRCKSLGPSSYNTSISNRT